MELEQEKKIRLETKLLSILLFFGLLCVFIIPPFQTPDEDSHFKRAFTVASFNLIPQVNEEGKLGFYLPKAILEFESSYRYMIGDIDQKINYRQYSSSFSSPVDYVPEEFNQFSTVKTNPLLYLPQAIAMLFFRIVIYFFSLGKTELITPLSYMYAGRIGNLLFFTFCAHTAIRLIPFYKRIVFLLTCMPMTISLASSTSYDGMVIGISLLFTSVIFRIAFKQEIAKITSTHIAVLSILSFILIELKQVYFPLILLFFLIPKAKFENVKKRILNFLVILLVGVFSFGLWAVLSRIKGQYITNADPSGQLSFILSHPIQYFGILSRTFYELSYYYANSLVANLGWLDTNLPPIFIYFYIIVIILFSLLDSTPLIKISAQNKLVILAVFLISIISIETALYLTWTSIPEIGGVGNPIVSGVQGRYFIPILLLFLVIFYNQRIPRLLKENYRDLTDHLLIIFCKFSGCLMLFIIIVRYWIINT